MCVPQSADQFGPKKPGTPPAMIDRFDSGFNAPSSNGRLVSGERQRSVSQKPFKHSMRREGSLPATSAPLMAPIDVPMTQSGSMPASSNACTTPTW